ncbi:aminopeptidase [Rapidithrix thailandica]|uniref:Aminopeptidase n=1 Tax=Rapidithrix thailandica TaxID=413964 RepID=A0AAW9SD63_9BACT
MSFILKPLFRFILWLFNWKVVNNRPKHLKKCVIIVAPHTSNWDFPITALARSVLDLGWAKFIAKHTLFKPPLGQFFHWLGGIPVDRSKRNSLVEQVAEEINRHEKIFVAIAPEGTRSHVEDWKSGFYHIAREAKVPILCGYVDYYRQEVGVDNLFYPTDNKEEDIQKLKEFYTQKIPKTPALSSVQHPEMPPKKKWKNWLKSFLKIGVTVLIGYLLWNFSLVVYGVRQGYGQLNILWKAQPVGVFLNDRTYPDSLKNRIELIREIKQFTVDSLGLDPSGSYEKMYDQQGNPVLWVVTACEPFALKAKSWDFPLLGKTSYKGYFNHQLAIELEQELKSKGYDTSIREVNAWSTLGILNDPILSSFLYRDIGDLANLIIHELTHGTLYVKGNTQYNENLASFVGDEGAKLYLKGKYGENSPEFLRYHQQKEDRETFSKYILSVAKELDLLYASFEEHHSPEEKRVHKEAFIQRACTVPDSLFFHNKRYYSYFQKFKPNNTYFMGYKRYRGDQNQFKEEFEQKFNRDFKAYLTYLKEKYPSVF